MSETLTETELAEIERALSSSPCATFPMTTEEVAALCRSLRAAWAENERLSSLIDSKAAAAVTPTTPLLQKIVEVADLGSAQEFGDSLERLRAIRGMIIGESV